MKIDWHFQGFLSSREDDKVIGSVYRLIGSVPELTHVLPVYSHPDDTSKDANGQWYCRKPPVWEEEHDKWLADQQSIADECSSFEEYVKTARTMLAISK